MLQTGCKVAEADLALTAGEEDYTLDSAILLIKEAVASGSSGSYRMEQVSPAEIVDRRISTSAAASSGSTLLYALNGANEFMVYPTPASADTVTFYYVPRPVTLSSDSDTPSEIPAEYHPAIEFYALWRLSSYDDDASSGQGERYREEYDRWVKKARRYVNSKGNVRLPRAKVGRHRHRSADPSADYR